MNWTLNNALMDKYNRRVSREINSTENAGARRSSLTSQLLTSAFDRLSRCPQINWRIIIRSVVIDFTVHWSPINLSIQRRKKSITLQKKQLQRDLIMMKGSFQCNVHANFSISTHSLSAEQINSRDFFLRQIPRCPASEHHFVHYINRSLLCCGLI